ncbi:formate--tetrahydrofolate ligase [Aerococcus vaginalis]
MLTDIEIAQQNQGLPIEEIAKQVGLTPADINPYGHNKAKVSQEAINNLQDKENGHLILVTAMNPTPAGEGKTTTSVGLSDALSKLGKNTMVALREPSLGPTMGLKGGAAGGGYAQVVPMEDINLHFTGDMHAITTVNNLLAAIIDNHIKQGNELDIDVRRITWKRVVDLNDRALRDVVIGLGGPGNGYPREDGFDITVASEIMAILCLSKDLDDMQERFGNIVIGQNTKREYIKAKELGCEGAMTMLMKDAILPNLVQTLEHTPALVHGGPFANIAHGCNSVIATQTALKLADYVVTEAGFGADLGGEKFMDIKVPQLKQAPEAVVIVSTIRSLKMHGGVSKAEVNNGEENIEAVEEGVENLKKHIETMQSYNVPVVVALNHFTQDTDAEVAVVTKACEELGVEFAFSDVWANGGDGGVELAEKVLAAIDNNQSNFHPIVSGEMTVQEKIETIAQTVYGASGVEFSAKAMRQLKKFEGNGWGHLPVCMAKTQYSLSDDATLLGRPTDFKIHVRSLEPKIGAGFIVALTGDILTMPGLPKRPAAMNMAIDSDGTITGLF